MTEASEINPNAVVPIPDCSVDSLRIIIERLACSTRFQHYILRADELDAVWRHVDSALKAAMLQGSDEAELERLTQLLAAVNEAHDLVVEGSPREAIARLRTQMQ